MKILLIRHAESYSNTQGRMMSTTDLALTDKGVQQAERAGKYMCPQLMTSEKLYVFCSNLQRTRQTAECFLSQLPNGDVPIQAAAELSEMSLGELEGLTWDERYARYPEINTEFGLSYAVMPGGESCADVKVRCQRFVYEQLSVLEEDAVVCVFSHGITLRILVNTLLGRPDTDVNRLNWMENTAITEIDFDKETGVGRAVRINDFTHLGELGTGDYDVWGIFCREPY